MTTAPRLYAVPHGPEISRIVALPWRERDMAAMAKALTERLRTPTGSMTLHGIQAAALLEVAQQGGGFLAMGVGSGKTLVSVLVGELFSDVTNVVLLVPAALVAKTRLDIKNLAQHFVVSKTITVLSYESLGTTKQANILTTLAPDMLVADEAHMLRNPDAGRTLRVFRYLKERPACRFVALSGSMMRRGLCDFAHIIGRALRWASPLPRPDVSHAELQAWDLLISPDVPAHAKPAVGALARLMEPSDGGNPRHTIRRRLEGSVGVVASKETGAADIALEIHPAPIRLDDTTKTALATMERLWMTPTGEVITDATDMAAKSAQLSFGFCYRWRWPDGVVDAEWLEARKSWRSIVRDVIQASQRSKTPLDTPLAVVQHLRKGQDLTRLQREALPYMEAWETIKDRSNPVTEAVWLSKDIVAQAANVAKGLGGSGVCVWVHSRAVAKELSEMLGWPYFGAGDDEKLGHHIAQPKPPSFLASIRAHGVGKNIQAISTALTVGHPANGVAWEQLLGRHHRLGQEADVVRFFVSLHTNTLSTSLAKAMADAVAIQATTGNAQKLLVATNLTEIRP